MIKIMIFALVGLTVGGGIGFGGSLFLFPPPEASADSVESLSEEAEDQEPENVAYAEFADQFIIPLMTQDEIEGLMVLSISIEVAEESLQTVYDHEPKLRSEFLQSLFNHANNGGFSGNFTLFDPMVSLRRELLAIAKNVVGDSVQDVLILDAIRQK